MKPQFSEAAKKLADEGSGLLAAIESSTSPNLFAKYGIKGFPTLKYFENGVYVKDYSGKRTAEDIYNFVKHNGSGKDELWMGHSTYKIYRLSLCMVLSVYAN